MPIITPFLWFDDNMEAAIEFYTSVFPGARITKLVRNGPNGPGAPGSVLTAEFELAGQKFMGVNGGPHFTFTEAVSFFVTCKDQAEVDRYWDVLTAEGGFESQCGWLKDRFGLSWQIVPEALMRTIGGDDAAGADRATQAMLKMKKLMVADLEKAYSG